MASTGVNARSEFAFGPAHCGPLQGGLGRAGTVAAMLLLQSGAERTAQAAIGSVRRVRPGAIETAVQEEFLQQWAQGLRS